MQLVFLIIQFPESLNLKNHTLVLATIISILVADAQLEVEEMTYESCSQRMGKFHQNEILLIISHLNALMVKALMDNHTEKAKD